MYKFGQFFARVFRYGYGGTYASAAGYKDGGEARPGFTYFYSRRYDGFFGRFFNRGAAEKRVGFRLEK